MSPDAYLAGGPHRGRVAREGFPGRDRERCRFLPGYPAPYRAGMDRTLTRSATPLRKERPSWTCSSISGSTDASLRSRVLSPRWWGFPRRPRSRRKTPPSEAGDLASLGLPEITLTVTADAFEGLPGGDLEAGRYLLTATIADGLEYAAAAIVGPPPRMTAEELIAEFERFASASPEGSPAASEDEGPPSDEIPLWFCRCPLQGGVGGAGGTTLQTVLDLPAGEWVLWGDDPAAPRPPSSSM